MSIPDPPENEKDENSRNEVVTEESLAEKLRNITVFYYKVLGELAASICDVTAENTRLKNDLDRLQHHYDHLKHICGITEIDKVPNHKDEECKE